MAASSRHFGLKPEGEGVKPRKEPNKIMVSQKSGRSYGPRFAAYVESRIAALTAASPATGSDAPTHRERPDARESGNSGENSPNSGSWEGCKGVRVECVVSATQATSSMSSYKAQKTPPEICKKPVNRSAAPAHMAAVIEKIPAGAELQAELKQAAAARMVDTETGEILKPYINPVVNPLYPLAAFQNPTNDPYVAMLLDRYGDMRRVFTKSEIFRKVLTPESEGGWGMKLGKLITLGKEHGLVRLLWALKITKANLLGKTNPAGLYVHVIRKGWEVDR